MSPIGDKSAAQAVSAVVLTMFSALQYLLVDNVLNLYTTDMLIDGVYCVCIPNLIIFRRGCWFSRSGPRLHGFGLLRCFCIKYIYITI